jgi:histidinol-phosphate aminotransferase
MRTETPPAAPAEDLFAALVSPTVLDLEAYVPGKPIEELRREKGVDRVVKLASNENPLGPPPAAAAALAAGGPHLHRYPDGYGFELKARLAAHWGVAVENLVLGNGSSEILEMAVRLLVRPGRRVVVASPSFSIYEITVQAQGGVIRRVPLRDHAVDLEGVLAAVDDSTSLVILGNPNNPTGSVFRRRAWEGFLAALPRRVGVVLDEAYAEYAVDPQFPVGREYLDEARPLLVARTFSKAYGLAALRIGYGLAPRGLVGYMNRLRLPFNTNAVAQAAARAALGDPAHVARSRSLNRQGLERLYRFCASQGLEWVPSEANFVLVRVPRAGAVAAALLDRGVIVRWTASFGMPDWLRVTVGTTAELDAFEAALVEVLAAPGEG